MFAVVFNAWHDDHLDLSEKFVHDCNALTLYLDYEEKYEINLVIWIMFSLFKHGGQSMSTQ